MTEIKFAIFDVGQVCYPYTLDYLNEYCMEKSRDKDVLVQKGGVKKFDYKPFMRGEVNFEQFCKDLCEYCDMDYSKKTAIEFNKQMHKGVGKFFPETMQTMDYLKKQGIKIGLLSNALPNLEGTGSALVDENMGFTSFDLKMLKPDVKIYETMLNKLNAKPEEVIFVDDKEENVNSANSIGINGIVYKRENILANVKKVVQKNGFLPEKGNQR